MLFAASAGASKLRPLRYNVGGFNTPAQERSLNNARWHFIACARARLREAEQQFREALLRNGREAVELGSRSFAISTTTRTTTIFALRMLEIQVAFCAALVIVTWLNAFTKIASTFLYILLVTLGSIDWAYSRAAPPQCKSRGWIILAPRGWMPSTIEAATGSPIHQATKYCTPKCFCARRSAVTQWCWRPDPETPVVASFPIDQNGFVTFGSFNHAQKLTSAARYRQCADIPALRFLAPVFLKE